MRKSVPFLLTPDVLRATSLLVRLRSAVGIPTANPYLFARAHGNSLGHTQSWDCLHQAARGAVLQNADQIQSTKLRKYIATVTQVFSLETDERHLGHDIRTHSE